MVDNHPQNQRRWYLKNKDSQLLKGRAYYLRNKEIVLKRHKAYERKRIQIIEKVKDQPCYDCHIKYPTCMMDFDHRPGEIKLGIISRMIRATGSIELINKEIAKCDLVCSNCHRWRTWARKMEVLESKAITLQK